MGSAVILPLDPEKGYQFEVAIFGGGTQVRLQLQKEIGSATKLSNPRGVQGLMGSAAPYG
jgi:hypothetical protein